MMLDCAIGKITKITISKGVVKLELTCEREHTPLEIGDWDTEFATLRLGGQNDQKTPIEKEAEKNAEKKQYGLDRDRKLQVYMTPEGWRSGLDWLIGWGFEDKPHHQEPGVKPVENPNPAPVPEAKITDTKSGIGGREGKWHR
jgi:hypothetical protein